MRFLHAADLHLDSPLRGLDRYEGAPVEELRGATRRAFENLVALCLSERVDFLLLAGDLYDGSWKDYRTGLFVAAQLSKLRAADIPVFFGRGNHDAESNITRSLRRPRSPSPTSPAPAASSPAHASPSSTPATTRSTRVASPRYKGVPSRPPTA